MAVEVLIFDEEGPAYRDALAERFPDAVFHAARTVETALPCCPRIGVLVALAHEITPELVAAAPGLRWIQALTTGTDHLLSLPNLAEDVIITSARGIHGPQMSELALLYMIALSRRLPAMLANQRAGRWQRWQQPVLAGKTVLVVGVGAIAEHLAGCCRAFGMRVIGVSAGRTAAPGFDAVHGRTRLNTVVREADFVVVLTPYTPETHHLIGADTLAAMAPRAFLINLARGNVVDEAALISHLRAGRIAGAGLDVFTEEPPAPDNPLWTMETVIMTPRIGGMSDIYCRQVLPVIEANLRAYLAGALHRLLNVVPWPPARSADHG